MVVLVAVGSPGGTWDGMLPLPSPAPVLNKIKFILIIYRLRIIYIKCKRHTK